MQAYAFIRVLVFGSAVLAGGPDWLTPRLYAASRTWTGTGANAFWSTADNWSPPGPPVDGDSLTFPSSAARLVNSNDLTELRDQSVILPTLSIAQNTAPNNVLVKWSSAYPEFQLQSVNSLDGPGPHPFNNVTTPPVLVGGKFTVTNDASGPRQFFRLAK
jgi:hypothetical protein